MSKYSHRFTKRSIKIGRTRKKSCPAKILKDQHKDGYQKNTTEKFHNCFKITHKLGVDLIDIEQLAGGGLFPPGIRLIISVIFIQFSSASCALSFKSIIFRQFKRTG